MGISASKLASSRVASEDKKSGVKSTIDLKDQGTVVVEFAEDDRANDGFSDLVFIIDVSGSMGHHMDTVRAIVDTCTASGVPIILFSDDVTFAEPGSIPTYPPSYCTNYELPLDLLLARGCVRDGTLVYFITDGMPNSGNHYNVLPLVHETLQRCGGSMQSVFLSQYREGDRLFTEEPNETLRQLCTPGTSPKIVGGDGFREELHEKLAQATKIVVTESTHGSEPSVQVGECIVRFAGPHEDTKAYPDFSTQHPSLQQVLAVAAAGLKYVEAFGGKRGVPLCRAINRLLSPLNTRSEYGVRPLVEASRRLMDSLGSQVVSSDIEQLLQVAHVMTFDQLRSDEAKANIALALKAAHVAVGNNPSGKRLKAYKARTKKRSRQTGDQAKIQKLEKEVAPLLLGLFQDGKSVPAVPLEIDPTMLDELKQLAQAADAAQLDGVSSAAAAIASPQNIAVHSPGADLASVQSLADRPDKGTLLVYDEKNCALMARLCPLVMHVLTGGQGVASALAPYALSSVLLSEQLDTPVSVRKCVMILRALQCYHKELYVGRKSNPYRTDAHYFVGNAMRDDSDTMGVPGGSRLALLAPVFADSAAGVSLFENESDPGAKKMDWPSVVSQLNDLKFNDADAELLAQAFMAVLHDQHRLYKDSKLADSTSNYDGTGEFVLSPRSLLDCLATGRQLHPTAIAKVTFRPPAQSDHRQSFVYDEAAPLLRPTADATSPPLPGIVNTKATENIVTQLLLLLLAQKLQLPPDDTVRLAAEANGALAWVLGACPALETVFFQASIRLGTVYREVERHQISHVLLHEYFALLRPEHGDDGEIVLCQTTNRRTLASLARKYTRDENLRQYPVDEFINIVSQLRSPEEAKAYLAELPDQKEPPTFTPRQTNMLLPFATTADEYIAIFDRSEADKLDASNWSLEDKLELLLWLRGKPVPELNLATWKSCFLALAGEKKDTSTVDHGLLSTARDNSLTSLLKLARPAPETFLRRLACDPTADFTELLRTSHGRDIMNEVIEAFNHPGYFNLFGVGALAVMVRVSEYFYYFATHGTLTRALSMGVGSQTPTRMQYLLASLIEHQQQDKLPQHVQQTLAALVQQHYSVRPVTPEVKKVLTKWFNGIENHQRGDFSDAGFYRYLTYPKRSLVSGHNSVQEALANVIAPTLDTLLRLRLNLVSSTHNNGLGKNLFLHNTALTVLCELLGQRDEEATGRPEIPTHYHPL